MLQNRFLLSILLVTASLRVSTAIRCSVCEAEPVVLMTVNGIAFSMDTNLQFSEAPTEYNRAQMQSMTEPMCEESECGEVSKCLNAIVNFLAAKINITMNVPLLHKYRWITQGFNPCLIQRYVPGIIYNFLPRERLESL